MNRNEAGAAAVVMRRLAGFTGWPLLSLVTPLVAMPIIARFVGDGWSGVVTAMSIGTFGSNLAIWGWSYAGPALVAQASETERARLYTESVCSRLLMLVFVLPATMIVTLLLAPTSVRLPAVLVASAFTMGALSPQWFCIGVGRPKLLGLYDTLPRVIATIASVPIMLWTQSMIAYPLLLIATLLIALWLFPRRVITTPAPSSVTLRDAWRSIRSMASIASASIVGVAYSYAPVPIATALLLSIDSSRFASADQLYRYALFAVTALGNALQGWALEVEGPAGRRRHHAAIALHAVLGLLGAAGIAFVGPWATRVLFGAQVAAGPSLTAWYAVAFLFISASTPFLRNILVPNGRQKTVLLATMTAAVLGIIVMVLAGLDNRAAGIAAGLALSEALIMAVTTLPALRVLSARYGSRMTPSGSPIHIDANLKEEGRPPHPLRKPPPSSRI
ncbi:hypothetical protein FAM23867_001805 [Propionibacterium freudenreichii]|uniref:lipopolysaccharide biosynthesis protein n=1 Tax=Propionibacterium freudenreichii TaxID=1744 RepID=UPI00254B6C77|nr:hypothetical protein [Propionibacterium freudenreichii]MDK9347715.1 hypothetical protein [Propionibacterium freudenreichii]